LIEAGDATAASSGQAQKQVLAPTPSAGAQAGLTDDLRDRMREALNEPG
jgi:hypothetical protein